VYTTENGVCPTKEIVESKKRILKTLIRIAFNKLRNIRIDKIKKIPFTKTCKGDL
jgi:hypothetical protein